MLKPNKLFTDDFTDYLNTVFFNLNPHVATDKEMIYKESSYHNIVDANLPLFVTDGHGNMQFGAGNPATGYELQSAGGLDIFSKAIHRQGSDLNEFLPHNGSIVYDADAGGQAGNPSYADWNWNFGIAATNGHKLSDFDIHQKVAVDGKVFLDLIYNAQAHAWDDAKTHAHVISDGGGALNKVDENSQNIKFYKAAIDAVAPALTGHEYEAGHTYTVDLVGLAHNTNTVLVHQHMDILV